MKVKISMDLFNALEKKLSGKPFFMDSKKFRYGVSSVPLTLRQYSIDDCRLLQGWVNDKLSIRGAKTLKRDIESWIHIATNKGGLLKTKARSVQQASELLIELIGSTARKHLYQTEDDDQESAVLGYYVSSIKFHEAVSRGDDYTPPFVRVRMWYMQFGNQCSDSFSLQPEQCLGKTPEEILTDAGYMLETPVLRSDYEYYVERFDELWDKIGKQMLAVGTGDDDNVDGNDDKGGDRGWWWGSRTSKFRLDQDGTPSKVLIDIFKETDRQSYRAGRNSDESPDPCFWSNTLKFKRDDVMDDMVVDKDDEKTDDDTTDKTFVPEIPLHPYVTIFDLKRHRRMSIHVGNLTDYEYDVSVRQKLILPDLHSEMIDTLLGHTGNHFQDVMVGKAGGTIILCQGSSGTGKTLTAEIYAESTGRPLYVVQCAQLGTDPDTLESNLMKVLARGRRWNAVMLLDEADVYVSHRGTDLTQNAIVGVFLRVLEYHAGVLFLTTNRGDLVDDAILSRCVVRIPYSYPSRPDLAKIWRILADQNKVELSDDVINCLVNAHPRISGRDVKNLLKLAMMVSQRTGQPVTEAVISKVKEFKPTMDLEPTK